MINPDELQHIGMVLGHNMNNWIQVVFPVSAVCFHFWTAIIGFLEQGLYGGILSFLFPLAAESYWAFENLCHNTPYVALFLLHLAGGLCWWKALPRRSN